MAHTTPTSLCIRNVALALAVLAVVLASVACSSESASGSAGVVPALPCAVDAVLVASCQKCHSSPPQFGAPMPLVTYADLQAPARSNPSQKVYEVVETRIHDTAAPMRMPASHSSANKTAKSPTSPHGWRMFSSVPGGRVFAMERCLSKPSNTAWLP